MVVEMPEVKERDQVKIKVSFFRAIAFIYKETRFKNRAFYLGLLFTNFIFYPVTMLRLSSASSNQKPPKRLPQARI